MASTESGASAELTPRERRTRRTAIGLGMALGVAGIAIFAVILYWRLYLLGPNDDPFTRGPYLVRVTQDEAQLRWRTSADADVETRALDEEGRELPGRDGVIRGLRPGTRYTWTASIDGRARASGGFATPSPDPERPVRFAVLADYGDGGDGEYAVARTIAAWRPDFVITAGDNSYLAAPDVLLDRNVFRPLAEVMRNAPVYVDLGDHDRLPPGDGAIRAAFDIPPEVRRTLSLGTVQIVMLGVEADEEAAAFARRELARLGFSRRFVVVHRPLKPGNPLLPVVRAAGVDAVFSGHLHRYERRPVEGVPTFTVGTGGVGPGAAEFTLATPEAVFSTTALGYLRVEITSSRVRTTFVDASGRALDRSSTP